MVSQQNQSIHSNKEQPIQAPTNGMSELIIVWLIGIAVGMLISAKLQTQSQIEET